MKDLKKHKIEFFKSWLYVYSKNFCLMELRKRQSMLKKELELKDIEIKNSYAFDASIPSNIIYLLSDVSKSLGDVTSKSKSNSTLVVAEFANACKSGSCINFVVVENKLKFEYNKNNAIKAGLKTNDDIKALAINIE